MKLPIIIQHHPEGYTIKIPDVEFKEMQEKANIVDKEEYISRMVTRVGKNIKNPAGIFVIPDSWKVPCKKYSGFLYGLETLEKLSGEADTEEELIKILTDRAIEVSNGFTSKSVRDWPTNFKVIEIEI